MIMNTVSKNVSEDCKLGIGYYNSLPAATITYSSTNAGSKISSGKISGSADNVNYRTIDVNWKVFAYSGKVTSSDNAVCYYSEDAPQYYSAMRETFPSSASDWEDKTKTYGYGFSDTTLSTFNSSAYKTQFSLSDVTNTEYTLNTSSVRFVNNMHCEAQLVYPEVSGSTPLMIGGTYYYSTSSLQFILPKIKFDCINGVITNIETIEQPKTLRNYTEDDTNIYLYGTTTPSSGFSRVTINCNWLVTKIEAI